MAFVLENEFGALALDASVQDTNTALGTIIARLALLADDASVDAVNTTLANTIHGDLAGLIAAVNDAEATLVTINTRAQVLSTEATLQAAVTAIEALGGDPVATEATLANLLAEAVLIKASVDGLLTDTQLRASPVSVAVTDFPAEVEVKNDAGNPLATADAGLGTDGAAPPAVAGTGVRGWTRGIYEKLSGALDISDRAGRVLGKITTDDGAQATIGATTDAATASGTAGTLQSYTRRIRDKIDALVDRLPAALAPNGGLKVEQNPTGYNEPPGNPFSLGNGGTTGTIDTATLGRWVTVQVGQNSNSNTLTWECSNDGVNWLTFTLQTRTAGSGTGGATASASPNIYTGQVPTRYVRFRVTVWTAGTVDFDVKFHSVPTVPMWVAVDTELPTGTTLADAASNPSAPAVGADLSVWNGTTWDRVRGSITNGLLVDVSGRGATATDQDDTAISSVAIQLLAANTSRKGVMIQNVGASNMRVTFDGSTPTATHGKRVAPGGMIALSMPFCATGAIKAIREAGSDTVASVTELV
jgi:hypothetical protein